MALTPIPPERLYAVMADGSNPLTYGEMAVKRDRIAHSLTQRLPKDVVAGAVYAKNCVEWVLCREVCAVMGLRFSPINWHLVASEVAYIVHDCDADVVFYTKEFAQNVAMMRASAPTVKTWVCMDGVVEGSASLSELVAAAPPDAKAPQHSRLGGSVSYTGGTTGKPKGAVRVKPVENPEHAMSRFSEGGFMRMMPEPIELVCAPMYHAMPTGWYLTLNAVGATHVFMPKFDGEKAFAAIERFRVNGFYMPPILLKRLLQVPEETMSRYDVSTVKAIMSGGAACPTSVKKGITAKFGPVLHELYGASELGGVTIMDPEHMLVKPFSCGKPCSGMDVLLLDDNKQRITTPGVPGEIFAKGQTIDGYHKLEEKTKESRFGDYFSVGDVGYFDEDGYLYISDRKIDMIVSGGVNIYPAQVEDVLQGHPDVADVAVFGVPDEEYGESVHAALKLVAGRRATAEEVLLWCEGKIGKFQLPREHNVSFHAEEFPRSEAGKLRKKVLKDLVLASPKSRL